jgi:hypothetical protein
LLASFTYLQPITARGGWLEEKVFAFFEVEDRTVGIKFFALVILLFV